MYRMLIQISKYKKIHRSVFELWAPEAVSKGVLSSSYCCYGNLLRHENDSNTFTNGWARAVFWYHDNVASSDKEP